MLVVLVHISTLYSPIAESPIKVTALLERIDQILVCT